MENKPDKSDANRFNAKVAELKAEGWAAHRDSCGWYLVMPDEKEPENGPSLGSNGREHYRTEKDVWKATVLLDRSPELKRRDNLRMAAWVVFIGATLVAPFIINAKIEAWRDKQRLL